MNDEIQTENETVDESLEINQHDHSEDTADVDAISNDESQTDEEPKTRSRNQNAKARLRRKLGEAEQRNQQLLVVRIILQLLFDFAASFSVQFKQ